MDAPAAAPKRMSTGMCTILRGEQVLEQQNCKAMAEAEGAGESFAKGITYVWPSGNRTAVGGTDEDFTVNGNLAAPLTDTSRGVCLKVEKTGNTFCYKEGAKVKAAAKPAEAKSAEPKPGDAAAKAPEPAEAKPGEAKATAAKKSETTAVAAAVATAPASHSTASAVAEQLAEEAKLRKSAEDEVKLLKAEIARLNEAEAQRAAAEKKSAEAEAASKAEAKTRADATLAELDKLKASCAARDALACQRAIVLAREASITGTIDKAKVGELEQLQLASEAPFGIPSLAFLGAVPRSTWATGSLAVLLGIALLVVSRRRAPAAYIEPTGTLPGLEPAPGPSLDPFSSMGGPLPPLADTLPKTTPPPLPAFASGQ
jgi:hypothetical protein